MSRTGAVMTAVGSATSEPFRTSEPLTHVDGPTCATPHAARRREAEYEWRPDVRAVGSEAELAMEEGGATAVLPIGVADATGGEGAAPVAQSHVTFIVAPWHAMVLLISIQTVLGTVQLEMLR